MRNIKVVTFLLLVSVKSFCSDNEIPLMNPGENQKDIGNDRDTVVGLTRYWTDDRKFKFEYRSEEDYKKNSCTRPLKKVIDCVFCENRDSCCIRNKIDPKVCASYCFGLGIPCGEAGALIKFISIGLAAESSSRDFCSECACNLGWFPSCSESYDCGEVDENCFMNSTLWGSSFATIGGCTLISCLLCKEGLKEKGQNDRGDY